MQTCNFCLNPENTLSLETCCTQCIKLKDSPDPVIQTAKKMAMASEFGGIWESKHGRYFISKDGEFTFMGG